MFLCVCPHLDLHSFPTRRSSDLVIPGHGSLTDKEGLKIYYNVLKDIEGILTPLALSGLSLNDVKKLKPLEKYDGDYGKGFMDPNSFISIVYEDIYRNINK
mgnify:CR=1 FL=1